MRINLHTHEFRQKNKKLQIIMKIVGSWSQSFLFA